MSSIQHPEKYEASAVTKTYARLARPSGSGWTYEDLEVMSRDPNVVVTRLWQMDDKKTCWFYFYDCLVATVMIGDRTKELVDVCTNVSDANYLIEPWRIYERSQVTRIMSLFSDFYSRLFTVVNEKPSVEHAAIWSKDGPAIPYRPKIDKILSRHL